MTATTLQQVLTDHGFKNAPVKHVQAQADAAKLSHNGSYSVKEVYTKGDTTVTVEQNQAPDDYGDGMTALVTHPPVAVIDGPKGRVAFNPSDLELAAALVTDLA